MNIFYLDNDPEICAAAHCDKHVVKMILEYAQLLSTAHRVLDNATDPLLYKATHVNHPCAKWVRESSENYKWLYNLFGNLCIEYTYRYNRLHATDIKLSDLLIMVPKNIKIGPFTPPPQCMPDYCKDADTVQAYKNYYVNEKSSFAKWTERLAPIWFDYALI